MPRVEIRFRDTETADEATHAYDTDRCQFDDVDDDEGFYWTDGNGACDCERMRVLSAALGRSDPNIACGSSRVTIVSATFDGVAMKWADR